MASISTRRVLAIFLSFWVSGAGHVAIGRARRGAVWYAAELALFTAGALAGCFDHGILIWVFFGSALLLRLVAAADAYLRGAEAGSDTPAVAIVGIMLAMIVGAAGGAVLLRWRVIEAHKVSAGSMAPTLIPGDHFFVSKLARSPSRGDVIVFKTPRDLSKDYVKRVVAIGGDTIELHGRVLAINGAPVPAVKESACDYIAIEEDGSARPKACEAYQEMLGEHRYTVMYTSAGLGGGQEIDATRVPEGSVFVLGDNRDNSYDSRAIGPVASGLIKGTAVSLWWSSSVVGTRLDRFGQSIR
jgi:signal peptidase I